MTKAEFDQQYRIDVSISDEPVGKILTFDVIELGTQQPYHRSVVELRKNEFADWKQQHRVSEVDAVAFFKEYGKQIIVNLFNITDWKPLDAAWDKQLAHS